MPTAARHLATAWIGFGSNLGDRHALLVAARARLCAFCGIACVAASALYESAPVGGPAGQGNYLNAVVQVATALAPLALLHRLQAIEAEFGRVRNEHWGARTLDLDLLFYDDLVVATNELTLPHPRLQERAFVLIPACELAPDLLHPLLGKRLRQLCAACDDTQVRRAAQQW